MSSPETFKINIDRWVQRAAEKNLQFASTFCLELASEIQEKTPVKTGNLKSAWRAELNKEPAGAEGIDATAAAAGLRVGDTFYYTNNTSYAVFVEFDTRPHDIYPKGPPDGAKMLHWKTGGEDFFSTHVRHPGTTGQAFVRSVIARADDIAQDIANRLGTQDSNLITGS